MCFMGALFAACGITRNSSSTSSEVRVELSDCISEETTPEEVVTFALDAIDDTEMVTLGQNPGEDVAGISVVSDVRD